MFPRTRLIPLGALVLLTACGAPPQPLPTSPPLVTPSAEPMSLSPPLPLITQLPPTGYPTYAPGTVRTTTAATTKSPTPTPSHAARCSTSPTRAQIITLVEGQPGVPDKALTVAEGPYCSGDWSFSTVQVSGETTDPPEPLMVVATGTKTLTLVAAGSDVCIDRVVDDAPAGIRVLACGF